MIHKASLTLPLHASSWGFFFSLPTHSYATTFNMHLDPTQ